MELRRATDALLRSQASPFTCLLNPSSTTTRWHAGQQLRKTQSSHRTFTSSSKTSYKPVVTTTTTSAPLPTNSQTPSSKSSTEALSDLSKGLGWGSPGGIQMPSKFATIPQGSASQKLNFGGSSSADLLNAWKTQNAGKRLTPAQKSASDFDFDSMRDPSNPSQSIRDANNNAISKQVNTAPVPPRVQLRLIPAAGRTIYITDRTDLTKGIRQVDMLCARNRVRQDFTAQRYHERPGLKRKRLRRERWRKNFKASFKATVARVTELKKQGW